MLGKTDSDPLGDKVNHNLAGSIDTTDLIYQPPPESDTEGKQPTEEIAKETEMLARATWFEAAAASKKT
jgi:hypothetical protein